MAKTRSENEQDDFHKRVAGALGGALAGVKEGEKQQREKISKRKFKIYSKLPDSFTKPKQKRIKVEKKMKKKESKGTIVDFTDRQQNLDRMRKVLGKEK
jgi:hypothetical protein